MKEWQDLLNAAYKRSKDLTLLHIVYQPEHTVIFWGLDNCICKEEPDEMRESPLPWKEIGSN